MFDQPADAWVIFNVMVLALLALDLVLHRGGREMTLRSALAWSAAWVALAGLVGAGIYLMFAHQWFGMGTQIGGGRAALEYFTGYVIELSLSVDNLFVFIAIFGYFQIKGPNQHRVLFWGILGAVVMRAGMIVGGVALIHRFEWLLYLMGAFLILTGLRLAMQREGEEADPERSLVMRAARRVLPIAPGEHEGRFFTKRNGRWMATTLLLALVVVEVTDVVFALDSIPAVLAVTRDAFLAYTSNIMAILGLRAMYFALAGLMTMLRFLRYGLAAVLVFIGVKMLLPLVGAGELGVGLSLGVVMGLLGAAVAASLFWPIGGVDARTRRAEDGGR